MVQISTEEGKSVTLAVTTIILTLFGFDVSCACYSQYLSDRDYNAFKNIFQCLGLLDHIKYGTFNKLCEFVINKNGNIRENIETLIQTGKNNAQVLS